MEIASSNCPDTSDPKGRRQEKWFQQAHVLESLWLATRDLFERSATEGLSFGGSLDGTLYRYVARMSSRPTPYGLFAGVSFVEIGDQTAISLQPLERYVRRTRLDTAYLCEIAGAICRIPEIRRELLYVPNSSIVHQGDRLHCVEAHEAETGRSYRQVALEGTQYLIDTLYRSEKGATLSQLATALVDDGSCDSLEDGTRYVEELIDSQVLVSELEPCITGFKTLAKMIETLERVESQGTWGERLRQTESKLCQMDSQGIGIPLDDYGEAIEGLRELTKGQKKTGIFHVDMLKPTTQARLGNGVIHELVSGIRTLLALSSAKKDPFLEFKNAFAGRYGDRTIPLVEVLDDELGIGFVGYGSTTTAEPLLDGIRLSLGKGPNNNSSSARDKWLLETIEPIWTHRLEELDLGDVDLDRMASWDSPRLPDSMAAFVSIAASSRESIECGDFLIFLRSVAGPSGVRLLARFCDLSPDLAKGVQRHVREEEQLRPNSVFAEVVHLPEGRLGNVLARPVLRGFEIPYLGSSGAPLEQQLPITDLLVTVRSGRVILLSSRLKREIIPRLTTAHNYHSPFSLPVYRFLAMLQTQDVTGGLLWSWGVLENAAYLPRVRSGKTVLSRARWLIKGTVFEVFSKIVDESARFEAVQAWRIAKKMPRFVYVVEGDNELLIDLQSHLAVVELVAESAKRSAVRLAEMFPGPDQLWVDSPEGKYVHELIIPLLAEVPNSQTVQRSVSETESTPLRQTLLSEPSHSPKKHGLGSEWIFAKLYCGPSSADRILCETLAPTIRTLKRINAFEGWFFIRYADPEWHLRIRFLGEAARLHADVLPAIERAMQAEMLRGRCWKFQFDTYEPESERYGGLESIGIVEQLFYHDSAASLAMLPGLLGDSAAETRWRVALVGVDQVLEDFKLTLEERVAMLTRLRDGMQQEFNFDARLKRLVGNRYRKERRNLEGLLSGDTTNETEALAWKEIHKRSRRSRELVDELCDLSNKGRLTQMIPQIAGSIIHMHVNRVLRAAHRAQEAILYHFLSNLYGSRKYKSTGSTELTEAT